MLFSRRKEPRWPERLRVLAWPRRSWMRSGKYFFKRLIRITGTPHNIALGCAIGAWVSFTPFVGLHFLISFVIALALGGNLLASALGTSIGNPLSFPFIWALTFNVGTRLLGLPVQPFTIDGFKHQLAVESWVSLWPSIVKPMAIGAIPTGFPVAVVIYLLVRYGVSRYQRARRGRLARRALAPPARESDQAMR